MEKPRRIGQKTVFCGGFCGVKMPLNSKIIEEFQMNRDKRDKA
jgi:hypothetical protein